MTSKEILEEMKEWYFADEELHQFQVEWLFEQVEKKLVLDELVNKYVSAYSRIDQIYRVNYEQRPNEYESGYLDGLDTALRILEEVEE